MVCLERGGVDEEVGVEVDEVEEGTNVSCVRPFAACWAFSSAIWCCVSNIPSIYEVDGNPLGSNWSFGKLLPNSSISTNSTNFAYILGFLNDLFFCKCSLRQWPDFLKDKKCSIFSYYFPQIYD